MGDSARVGGPHKHRGGALSLPATGLVFFGGIAGVCSQPDAANWQRFFHSGI